MSESLFTGLTNPVLSLVCLPKMLEILRNGFFELMLLCNISAHKIKKLFGFQFSANDLIGNRKNLEV